jgi:hypothetical protein
LSIRIPRPGGLAPGAGAAPAPPGWFPPGGRAPWPPWFALFAAFRAARAFSTTGLRHVGQTCCRSSQLLRQPRWRICPQGNFFGRERSLTGAAGRAGGRAPGATGGACGLVTDQGLISSRHIMHVSSLSISSTVASPYRLFISCVARRYRRNAVSRFTNDLVVMNRSRIIWIGMP